MCSSDLIALAAPHRPSHVVRLTADCPLVDWNLIDRTVELVAAGDLDYASTALRPSWPDGLDVEVMTFAALETAWREATSPVDREHVTQFIVERPDRFRQGSIDSPVDLSAMRWTVDEPRDFDFVSRVYEALYPTKPAFTDGRHSCIIARQAGAGNDQPGHRAQRGASPLHRTMHEGIPTGE